MFLSFKKKKIHRVYVTILAVFLIMLLPISGCGRKNRIRKIYVSEISGTVSIVEADKEYEAYKGVHLQDGYTMVTSGDSYARMILDNDKYIKLEEGSRATVDRLSNGRTEIHLERGAITNEITKPLYEGQSYLIHTPNATLAVRGTFFRVELANSKEGDLLTKVFTYGGSVVSQRKLPNGEMVEESVVIGEGYRATISMDEIETVYLEEPVNEEMEHIIPMYPENILETDLVDMYFASQKGHEMFVPSEIILDTMESRNIDIDSYTSAYEQAASLGLVGKGTAPDDNFPLSVENTAGDGGVGHHAPWDGEKESISEQFRDIIDSIIPDIWPQPEEEKNPSGDEELAEEETDARELSQADSIPGNEDNDTDGNPATGNDGDNPGLNNRENPTEPDFNEGGEENIQDDSDEDSQDDENLENDGNTEDNDEEDNEEASDKDLEDDTQDKEKETDKNKDKDSEDKDSTSNSSGISSPDSSGGGNGGSSSGGGTGSGGSSCRHTNTEETTTDATCTAEGKIVKRCKSCGTVIKTTIISAKGHVEHGGPMTPATCTDDGFSSMICLVCNEEVSREVLPAVGHNMEVINTTPATCQQGTVTVKKCSRCPEETTTTASDIQSHLALDSNAVQTECTFCNALMIHYDNGSQEFDIGLKNVIESTYDELLPTGYLMDIEENKELNAMKNLTIQDNGEMESLKGIKYITTIEDLTLLNCSVLDSVSLDNSTNIGLKKLTINSCNNVSSIDLAFFSNLQEINLINEMTLSSSDSINLRSCTNLKSINLSGANFGIDGIFLLDGCNELEIVSSNALKDEIKVSGKSGIKSIIFKDSGVLKDIILVNLTGLKAVDVSEGMNNIVSIDVSDCTNLETLKLAQNSPLKSLVVKDASLTEISNLSEQYDLEYLDITNCKHINQLEISSQKLSTLYAANATGLEYLYAMGARELDMLNIQGCSGLKELKLSNNNLNAVSFTGCTALEDLQFMQNSIISYLDLSSCTKLKRLDTTDCSMLSTLNLSGCIELQEINVSNCERLTQLDMNGFSELSTLDVSNCSSLTTLDLSDCTSIQEVIITGTNLTEANIEVPDGIDKQFIIIQ